MEQLIGGGQGNGAAAAGAVVIKDSDTQSFMAES